MAGTDTGRTGWLARSLSEVLLIFDVFSLVLSVRSTTADRLSQDHGTISFRVHSGYILPRSWRHMCVSRSRGSGRQEDFRIQAGLERSSPTSLFGDHEHKSLNLITQLASSISEIFLTSLILHLSIVTELYR